MKNNYASSSSIKMRSRELAFLITVLLFVFSNLQTFAQTTKTIDPGTFESLSSFQSEASTSSALSAQVTAAGLQQFYSATGKYTLSADGIGSLSTSMTIRVDKPNSQAKVIKAVLLSSTFGYSIPDGCVTLAGVPISWAGSATTSYLKSNWADVTSIVASQIDAFPSGISTLPITECNSSEIDGEALLVVFDDPLATEKTIVIMTGAANTTGDSFSVTLAQPIDPSAPGALLDMGLGIGFGYQPSGQVSHVSVNGSRLTSSAGGQDDGQGYNGALITVGGIGDANTNPIDPYEVDNDPRTDDELYSILPFITNSTTSLNIETINPSNNDIIFLAYFAMSGAAIIGEGILLSQTSTSGTVGDNHTVKATVKNSLGSPVPDKAVTFTILSGPNAGGTITTNTDANGEATYSYTGSGGAGVDNIQACFTDSQDQENCSNSVSFTWVAPACSDPIVTVPSIAPAANDAGICGALVTFEATATGSPDPTIVYTIIVEGVEQEITSPYIFPVGTTTVTTTATNDCGTDSETFNVEVTNTAPIINSVSGPSDPVAINNSMNLSVAYTDNNVTNAAVDWGDGSSVQNMSNPTNPFVMLHVYNTPGVYTVKVSLTDACSESSGEYIHQYVVVYDPNGGFVTGGGWIYSPAGAYVADPVAEGKANFGFVSKYKKGATVPDGQTQFQFHAAGFNFHSTSYEWLVVSGYKAQFKGVGAVNGSGDYGFLLSTVDGALKSTDPVDRFRIKVWDRGTGVVVYDNQMGDADDAEAGTAIGGGSIVIHEPMKGSSAKRSVAEESPSVTTEGNFNVYPTAFSGRATIAFSLGKAEDYVLEIFDIKGALVKKIASGTAEANKLYEFELRSDGMAEGVYITRLSTSTTVQSLKAVLKR